MKKFRGSAVLCFITLLIGGCSTSDRSSDQAGSATSLVPMEIADVQIYLLRLADVLGIDVPESVRKKIEINESRF